MSERTLHASGFVSEGVASGVRITAYATPLAETANGVIAKIREHHEVKVATTRDLDGWLRIVEATVDVGGTPMWHVFTTASDQWPMAEGGAA